MLNKVTEALSENVHSRKENVTNTQHNWHKNKQYQCCEHSIVNGPDDLACVESCNLC